MSRLVITIGLPGAGKTTRARAWIAECPLRRTRVNRDDLRAMMFSAAIARRGASGRREHEDAVTAVQHSAVRALLSDDYDVVVDDTNLNPAHVEALVRIGEETTAEIELWDMTGVSLQTCIDQDAGRAAAGGRLVGAPVIEQMHTTWLGKRRSADDG